MKRSKRNVVWLCVLPVLAMVALLVSGQIVRAGDDEGGGTIVFTKPVKAVVFEHKFHIAQGLDCDSCHSGLFEMATGTAEGNDDFTMASLYKGKYCGACHDGKTAFASNTRCTVCHIGVKGFNKRNGKAPAGSGGHGE
jgi:c(7)-type cytochrome triheme protein